MVVFPEVRRYHINADLTVEAEDADDALTVFQSALELTPLKYESASVEEEDE